MIVLSNEDHIIQIPTSDPTAKVSVERGVSLLAPTELVMLIPGTNDIPNSRWQFARLHIGRRLGRSVVEHLKEVVDGEGVKSYAPKALKDFDADDLVDLVDKCNHAPTLESWKARESRDEVRLAIANRLDALAKGKKTSTKKKGHQSDDDEDDD